MITWTFDLPAASLWIEVHQGHVLSISTPKFSTVSRLRCLNFGLSVNLPKSTWCQAINQSLIKLHFLTTNDCWEPWFKKYLFCVCKTLTWGFIVSVGKVKKQIFFVISGHLSHINWGFFSACQDVYLLLYTYPSVSSSSFIIRA